MAVRKITIRRGTASSWTSANPTLSGGEMGYETDTGKMKIGNGTSAWTSLAYFSTSITDGATNLDGLTDVTITSPSTGQVLKWNGSAWVNSADSTGTTINSLDDIGDVAITSVSSGQVLKWNGSAWVNAAESGGGGGASDLDDLTDVAISSPQYGQVLKYSGTEWYNDSLLLDNIGLVNTAGASNGDVLTFSSGYWVASAPTGGTTAPSTPHPFAMLV